MMMSIYIEREGESVRGTPTRFFYHPLCAFALLDGPNTVTVVYYESIKRELKRRLIYEYRCDERLKTKTEESTRLRDTGLVVELEHLKTKTRLIDKKFASVRGECEI